MRHRRSLDAATLDAIVAWLNECDERTWEMARVRWAISQHVFQREIAALVAAGRITDRSKAGRAARGAHHREAARRALAEQPHITPAELGRRIGVNTGYATRLRREMGRVAEECQPTPADAKRHNEIVARIYRLAWLRERWEARQ